ncbi:MAG: zeta toxin family protein, partial [Dehalococcoidia bacterium]
VLLGGHHVPEEIVRRRYQRGLHNFFNLYRPLAHVWRVYDNSEDQPVLVAQRLADGAETVFLPATWQAMQREAERR